MLTILQAKKLAAERASRTHDIDIMRGKLTTIHSRNETTQVNTTNKSFERRMNHFSSMSKSRAEGWAENMSVAEVAKIREGAMQSSMEKSSNFEGSTGKPVFTNGRYYDQVYVRKYKPDAVKNHEYNLAGGANLLKQPTYKVPTDFKDMMRIKDKTGDIHADAFRTTMAGTFYSNRPATTSIGRIRPKSIKDGFKSYKLEPSVYAMNNTHAVSFGPNEFAE